MPAVNPGVMAGNVAGNVFSTLFGLASVPFIGVGVAGGMLTQKLTDDRRKQELLLSYGIPAAQTFFMAPVVIENAGAITHMFNPRASNAMLRAGIRGADLAKGRPIAWAAQSASRFVKDGANVGRFTPFAKSVAAPWLLPSSLLFTTFGGVAGGLATTYTSGQKRNLSKEILRNTRNMIISQVIGDIAGAGAAIGTSWLPGVNIAIGAAVSMGTYALVNKVSEDATRRYYDVKESLENSKYKTFGGNLIDNEYNFTLRERSVKMAAQHSLNARFYFGNEARAYM